MDNFFQVGVVGETKDVDFDTSYENNTTDGEAREDFDDEFTEDESQRQNFSRNMLLKSFRHKVGFGRDQIIPINTITNVLL